MDTLTPDQQILQQPPQEDNTVVPGVEPQQPQAPQIDPEELDHALLELVKHAEKEDEDIRYLPLQKWKRNNFYFDNIQKIFWDSVARDYRTVDSVVSELQNFGPTEDIKIINIYRAFAESIVSALSVAAPNLEYFPEDADDPNDIQTAKAYSKITEIIEDHNDVKLLLIKIFTIHFNNGVVAAYNYYKSDAAYGTIRTPKAPTSVEKQVADVRCANCGELVDSSVPISLVPKVVNCPDCKATQPPDVFPKLINEDEVTDYEETPKGRVGIDIFGPTFVKMPMYARNQAGMGYLGLRIEDHLAKWRTVYEKPDANGESSFTLVAGGGDTYSYERWARIPPEYYGTLPKDMTTGRFFWFRPWYYRVLSDEQNDLLKEAYPNGCMVTVIGDIVVDQSHEKLDDVWTVSLDARSTFIHAESQGNAIVPIQDAENDLYNLGLQSIEYGIPETFAHPKTLNLKKYGETKNAPGMVSPALPPEAGKTIGDGFHTLKTATLSNEYIDFDKTTFEKGQFVSGALPSIWGGAMGSGSSRTNAEYQSSRGQALQRLQLTYEVIASMYANLMFKACKMFTANLAADENHVKKQNGTFINIWVTKSELAGSVGHVKAEVNGQLPQSWAQKKDFVMQLMTLQDPSGTVLKILTDPCNSELMKQITGMPDFYIPGENDRNKQYSEYYLLSQQESPDGGKTPSIEIDIDVDDHMVHAQVLKNILVGDMGIELHNSNPKGYYNCIAHYRQHELAIQAKMQSFAGGSQPGEQAPSSTTTTQS